MMLESLPFNPFLPVLLLPTLLIQAGAVSTERSTHA